MRATLRRRLERARKYEWDGKFPEGRRPGLKRDKRATIADRCHPITKAAGFEIIGDQYWDDIADSQWHVVKDSYYRYTSDQDGVNSCAAHSECNTAGACDASNNYPLVIHNANFSYYTTSGGRDQGSVIGANLELGRDKGRCPEEIWPQSKGWRAKPSAFAYEVAKFFRIREFYYIENLKQFVSALLLGFFVHAGYSGHAVSFNRYLGDGMLWFKNSWGNWGDNGFGSLSLNKIFFGYGAYAYKDTYAYYDPSKGWGRWEESGEWTPCPWKPQHDQEILGRAVNAWVDSQTMRKRAGKKLLLGSAAEETYRETLSRHGLAT